MKVKANGKSFRFTIKSIKRGSWVVVVDSVDGAYDGYWFGEIGSEREARQQARSYADRSS